MIQHKAHKTIGSFTTSFSLLDVSSEAPLQKKGETSSFFLYMIYVVKYIVWFVCIILHYRHWKH